MVLAVTMSLIPSLDIFNGFLAAPSILGVGTRRDSPVDSCRDVGPRREARARVPLEVILHSSGRAAGRGAWYCFVGQRLFGIGPGEKGGRPVSILTHMQGTLL